MSENHSVILVFLDSYKTKSFGIKKRKKGWPIMYTELKHLDDCIYILLSLRVEVFAKSNWKKESFI